MNARARALQLKVAHGHILSRLFKRHSLRLEKIELRHMQEKSRNLRMALRGWTRPTR
jgi:hypothetical protein